MKKVLFNLLLLMSAFTIQSKTKVNNLGIGQPTQPRYQGNMPVQIGDVSYYLTNPMIEEESKVTAVRVKNGEPYNYANSTVTKSTPEQATRTTKKPRASKKVKQTSSKKSVERGQAGSL